MTSTSATPFATSSTPRWVTAQEMAGLGVHVTRPRIEIGAGWGTDRQILLVFSPETDSNHGCLYAYRPTANRYLVIEPNTTWQAVNAARLAVGDAFARSDGYLVMAGELHVLPKFSARDARLFWFDCLEAEFTVQHGYGLAPADSTDRSGLALACTVAAAVRAGAEQAYVEALRGEGREPVVVDFGLIGRPGWVGRMPVASLRAAHLDVDYVHQMADRYDLAIRAAPPAIREGPRIAAVSLGLSL